MNTPRSWIMVGAVLAGLAVVTGAFGAHGLADRLKTIYGDELKDMAGLSVPATYKYVEDFKTAAHYQMTHALGLIALGLAAGGKTRRSYRVAAWSFVAGIVLFSGSLYVLVLTGQRWLGMITPFGGLAMIVAWMSFSVGVMRARSDAIQDESSTER